ncbi:hypothetical protein GW17_00005413 [Ensete ventricosum]|nr:hypothetical protein GW17_00005413 [Ensete ventricosum]
MQYYQYFNRNTFIAGSYALSGTYKGPDGFNNQIVSGVMAFVMGIVTMMRVGRNTPRKIANADINDAFPMLKGQMHQSQLPAPTVSAAEFSSVLKRLGELEEKVSVLSTKPAEMAPEKEEMLNAAVIRVDALEAELAATKKVTAPVTYFALDDALVQQQEILAFIDKKKKRRNKFFFFLDVISQRCLSLETDDSGRLVPPFGTPKESFEFFSCSRLSGAFPAKISYFIRDRLQDLVFLFVSHQSLSERSLLLVSAVCSFGFLPFFLTCSSVSSLRFSSMSPILSEIFLSGFMISSTLRRRTQMVQSFSVVFLYWFYVFS